MAESESGAGGGIPFTGGAVGFFGYDLVRTVEPLGEPNTDTLGLPDMALMLTDRLVDLRPPEAHGHDPRQRRSRCRAGRRAGLCDGGGDDRRGARSDWRAPCRARIAGVTVPIRRRARCRASSRTCSARSSKRMVARIVEYIHAGDAFQVVPSQRWSAEVPVRAVLDLPGSARGQPESVYVFPRLRRLPGRRGQPGAAADRERSPCLDDARSPGPARAARAPRRTGGSPESCWPTRRSAPST